MSKQPVHEIVIEELTHPPKMDWHGPAYRAACTCGYYRSSAFAYPGHAQTAGDSHVRAKTERRR